jgi:hypothetical protein
MTTTDPEQAFPHAWVAADPIHDIAHVIPLHPDLGRNLRRHPPFGQRQPKKEHSDQAPAKPQDPAHKVDDYA